MFFITIIALITSIDLKIKKWIMKQLSESFPIVIARGNVEIGRVRNYSLAFNLLKDKGKLPFLLSLFGYLITFISGIFVFLNPGKSLLNKTGTALIIGGGTSNIADRVKQGFVIDYIRFPKLKTGMMNKIFYNIGDFSIFAGTLLKIIALFFEKNKK